MTRMEDLLSGLVNSPPTTIVDAVVSAVGADGKVNVVSGDDIVEGVPCLTSYVNRKEGDVVACLVTGKAWRVIGAYGNEPEVALAEDVPPETVVRWGSGAPSGSGWVKSASGDVYVKDNTVYVARDLADPTPADPPARTTASKIIVSPTQDVAYRDGHIEDGEPHPIQGAWPTYPHPYSGAWFYGTKIKDTADRGTVSSMTITLYRKRNSGGIYQGARVRLYLHEYTSAPTRPPALAAAWSPGTLEPGQVKTFTLPASWQSALAAGTYRGVGCSAGVGSEYITYDNCGGITVYFS